MCHLQAGLKPVCDRADYSDGRCAVIGGAWSLSTPYFVKHNAEGLPWKTMRGSFLYSGLMSSEATMCNAYEARTDPVYANGNQRDGDTYCECPAACMCTACCAASCAP